MRDKLATTLLALAGLAAATAAQAQSNVTIYGIVDTAVERLTSGAAGSITRMPGLTGSLPSRLGFRGTEDLGGGLRAQFVLEMGIGVDTGTFNQGGRGFGRQSWVGLGGDWGTVSMGRQYSMLYYSLLEADILGPNIYGSGSIDNYLPNDRVDNSVAYRGRFSGFDLGSTYSFGRDTVNAGPSPSGTNCPGESSTDKPSCRQWSLMAKYGTATWGVAAAVDQFKGGAGAFAGLTSSAMSDRRATLNGWVRFSSDFKLAGGLIDRHNEASATTPDSKLWFLGAAYNVTPLFVLDGELFKLDYQNSANGARLLALRGTYLLSKRTAVYATLGRINNSGTLALSASNGAAGAAAVAGGSQTGVALGIRHAF